MNYFTTKQFPYQCAKTNEIKEKLISAALGNVGKYGWSEQSIQLAANQLGYSNALAHIVKPIELIHCTMNKWNSKLLDEIKEIRKDSTSDTSTKIKNALKSRLTSEIPFIATWPQAIRISLSPRYIIDTLKILNTIPNELSSLEEDTLINESSNMTIAIRNIPLISKTRRYFLLQIFLVTELYMLSDRSNLFNSTWAFLDNFFLMNMKIHKSFDKISMVNSAFSSLVQYSLASLAPYDMKLVEDMKKNIQENKLF